MQPTVNTQHAFSIIQDRINAKEREIQQVLQAAMEKYRRELRANIEYHEHLVTMAEESHDQNLALRHRVLADIYRSLFERA